MLAKDLCFYAEKAYGDRPSTARKKISQKCITVQWNARVHFNFREEKNKNGRKKIEENLERRIANAEKKMDVSLLCKYRVYYGSKSIKM